MKKTRYKKELIHKLKVFTALFIVSALLVQFFSNDYLMAYAQDKVIATYDIGMDKDAVTATLTSDGVLTVSGMGDTKDYTAETMPFSDNIDKISTLVIEEGVTSIGDYLFFGCRNLNDKLEIPKTIIRIGDYAFSGYSKETAPAFTYITNSFISADITVPVESKEEAPAETEQNPAQEQNKQSESAEDSTNTDVNTSEQPAETTNTESKKEDNTDSTVTLPEEQTPQASGKMEVKTIKEQEMGTEVFYPNQTGGYKAEKTNKSFRTQVEAVGYIEADRFVTVRLDNVITQHLPVKDGKLIIPDRPNYGIEPDEPDTAYMIHAFTGWSIDNQNYQPKDKYEIADSVDEIILTSQWSEQWSIDPQVKSEAKEDITEYSVIDKNTQKAIEEAEGYKLIVQWQINKKDKDDEASWKDIEDANSLIYKRKVESGDTSSYFRAKITTLKDTKLRTAEQPSTIKTDPVNGVNSLTPITVIYDANGGTGVVTDGTIQEGIPYKPLENPFTPPTNKENQVFIGWKINTNNVIVKKNSGGIVNNNDIIQCSDVIVLNMIEGQESGNITFTAQWSKGITVYLDSNIATSGDGTTAEKAVKTIDEAFNLLPSEGTLNTNKIIIVSDYTIPTRTLPSKSTTITAISYDQANSPVLHIDSNMDIMVSLNGDTKFENIKISGPDLGNNNYDRQAGIYANFHTLIMGDNIINSGGYIQLYGGSRTNNLTGSSNILIYSGYYKYVTGAGYNTNSTGDTHVSLFGGSANYIYAGTHKSGTLYGSTYVHGYGGRFGVFGGSRYGKVTGDTHIYIYGGRYDVYGASHVSTGYVENVFIEIFDLYGTTDIGEFCGGVYDGVYEKNYYPVNNTINIDIHGGTFNSVYGGGLNDWVVGKETTVRNGIQLNIENATIKGSVYLAGKYGSIDGNSTLRIINSKINDSVYAGGQGGTNRAGHVIQSDVRGNMTMYIDENTTIDNNVFLGGNILSTTTGKVILDFYGKAQNIYGGGNGASTSIQGDTKIIINNTAVISGSIYGGGEFGKLIGNSQIDILGGRIGSAEIENSGNIFGGGNNIGVTTSTINVKGTSDIYGNIYGGSNTTGMTTTSNVNIAGTVTNNVYAGGKGSGTTVTTADLNIEDGADIKGNAFGGSEEGTVTNSVVKLNGGYAENVFGGSDKASVVGSVKIDSLAGSNAGSIYAGCNASGSVKNPVLNLAGKAKNIFAGGNATDKTIDDVDGKSTINVTSNEANTITNVYGGANTSGKVNSPQINISGYVGNVYGGGLGKDTVTNDTQVNIKSGSNVTNSVFGGGEEGNVKNTVVTLETGSTVKNAYAGGNKAGVEGTIKLMTQTGSKATNVYGGSNSSGTVTKPILNIEGDATNIYGGGYEGGTNSGNNVGTIVDTPTITVTNGTITNLYGGGEKGPTVGTNNISISGGVITNVFGGGKSASSVNTAITLRNNTNALSSSVENIYGGSESSGLTESSHIEADGTVKNVFGGGKGASTIVKKTYIKTQNSSKAENIYGGSEEGKVINTTVVVMGPVDQSIYGGGLGSSSVVTGDTWVYVANDVKDSVYGGGNQGTVEGNTHVDIAKGTIGSADTGGHVFGGSNQAKVNGDTLVHIGSYVINTPTGATLPTESDKMIEIKGTVFGGGNTTSTGKDFDASDPYVLGNAVVEIGGTGYTLDIKKSIFGDGNKCVTNGDKTINIKDYTALGTGANTSIQRATTLLIENSDIELIGEKDTANLVTTIDYSLNRIDNLVLKGGTLLKLQSPVNLVMGLESQNTNGSLQTSDQANSDTTGNRLYIQQGQHVDLRINEDVSRPGYGDVKGFAQLGRYYVTNDNTKKPIDADAQGVYVMGSYYTDIDANTKSGFIVAENESLTGQSELHKGAIIEATTNSSSWRNWLLGSSVKNATKNMVISDEPGDGKSAMVTETWAADGSIYRIDPNSVTISGNNKYTIVNPNDITSTSPENTIGLSIETGQTGWLEQLKAGYIDSATGKIIPYKSDITDTVSVDDSLDMRSIVNDSQNPVINVKLYNSDSITTTDNTPLTVSFTVDRISEQTDGSEVKTGSIVVTLSITQKATESYTNVLVSQGKSYDRGEQSYNYDTAPDDKVATSVSRSSALTAQFAEKSETARTVTGYSLNFKNGAGTANAVLPNGTRVLMIDKSQETPVYYTYTVTTESSKIALTDFTKNGTSERYKIPTASIKKSNFIFIFDFIDTAGDKDLLVSLISEYSGGASSEKKLRFKATGSDRTYSISSQQDNSSAQTIPSYRMNGMFGVTLKTTASADANAGTDTTGSDLQMAAKVQLKLTNTETGTVLPIPKGWQIQSNGTRYSTSGDSATIILANSLTATSSDIYVIMSNMGDIPAGSYKLEISLVAGAMANYPSATLDTKTIIYRFKLTDDRYSIKSTIRDEAKQVIALTDADKTISYDVIRVSNGSSSTSNIETKLTLWKKNESGNYVEVPFTDTVEKVSDITTGREIPINNQILPWSTFKTISIKLKDTAEVGSYQLRYEILEKSKANGVLASEVSSFIVIKD